MAARNGFSKKSYIIAVDVGTTAIKCHVYDKEANVRGSCAKKVMLIFTDFKKH